MQVSAVRVQQRPHRSVSPTPKRPPGPDRADGRYAPNGVGITLPITPGITPAIDSGRSQMERPTAIDALGSLPSLMVSWKRSPTAAIASLGPWPVFRFAGSLYCAGDTGAMLYLNQLTGGPAWHAHSLARYSL